MSLWPQDASVEPHYLGERKNVLFKVDWVYVKLILPAVTTKVNLAFQIAQNSPPGKKAWCLCNVHGHSVLAQGESSGCLTVGETACSFCDYYSQNNDSNGRKAMLTVLGWSGDLLGKYIYFFFSHPE